jgi:hypothetical protein
LPPPFTSGADSTALDRGTSDAPGPGHPLFDQVEKLSLLAGGKERLYREHVVSDPTLHLPLHLADPGNGDTVTRNVTFKISDATRANLGAPLFFMVHPGRREVYAAHGIGRSGFKDIERKIRRDIRRPLFLDAAYEKAARDHAGCEHEKNGEGFRE